MQSRMEQPSEQSLWGMLEGITENLDLGMTLEPAIFNDAYRKLPQGIGLQCRDRKSVV